MAVTFQTVYQQQKTHRGFVLTKWSNCWTVAKPKEFQLGTYPNLKQAKQAITNFYKGEQ